MRDRIEGRKDSHRVVFYVGLAFIGLALGLVVLRSFVLSL